MTTARANISTYIDLYFFVLHFLDTTSKHDIDCFKSRITAATAFFALLRLAMSVLLGFRGMASDAWLSSLPAVFSAVRCARNSAP